MFVMWGKQNKTTLIHVNISFIASQNPLNTNEKFARNIAKCREISLELSQSATKFRSNYRGVPRNFARTYVDCSEISLSLKQQDSRNIVEKSLQTKFR